MRRNSFLLPILAGCLILLVCSNDNPVKEKPPEPSNRIWVPSDTVSAGTRTTIEVYLENIEPLYGVLVPLILEGTHFSIDSVSFYNSRFAGWELTDVVIDHIAHEILVYTFSSGGEKFAAGSGVAFRIYVWVHGNSPTQDIIIDSTFIAPSSVIGLIDTSYVTFTPTFEGGFLHVNAF